jgi:hypothetical protein
VKYRIIIGARENYPYEVQYAYRGLFGFLLADWKKHDVYSTLPDAEEGLTEAVSLRRPRPRAGTVIKVYTEEDEVVDRLKGKI